MRLRQYYRVVADAFDAEFCDAVIVAGEAAASMDGQVGHDPTNSLRDSTVGWIGDKPENARLCDPVRELMARLNDEHWGWKLEGFQSMQYTRYGAGQYYGWHTDSAAKPIAEKSRWNGMVRKLTMVVQLSDGGEYAGGDFQLEDHMAPPDKAERRIRNLTECRRRGAAVVFPAHLFHRVTEVASGTRRSLVAWFVGPPFV